MDLEKVGNRALIESDIDVHRLIYSATGNPHLEETLTRLDNLATRIWCLVLDRLPTVGDHVQEHVGLLRAQAVAGLAALDGVTVLSPEASPTSIVSFVTDNVHPHDIGTLLDERGIAVRTGHHCAQPLLQHLGCGPTTRASFALYNSHNEVERLVAGVAHALKVLG